MHPNPLLRVVQGPRCLLPPPRNFPNFPNFLAARDAGSYALECQRRSLRFIGSSTPKPGFYAPGRRWISGGTLNESHAAPHHSRSQVPGKDFQMGENTQEEAPFPLTDVDRFVLSQTDEEFTYHTWDELCQIIRTTRRFHYY
jgi:hypothetical protein